VDGLEACGIKARVKTILGAGGPIAEGLAGELRRRGCRDLRLVSRRPRKVDPADSLFTADLMDAERTLEAVRGSDTVYFTAGLPPVAAIWERQFPVILHNALAATRKARAKFVFFDNTYMYPQDGRPLTEETPFLPVGRKGRVRAAMASRLLEEMARGEIPVLIARAPEFYGPGRTRSFTHAFIIDPLKAGRKARVPVRDDTLRTLIWTPDASRALATLGEDPQAYGQTWHLPCDDARLTYRQFVTLAAEVFGREPAYTVFGKWAMTAAGLTSRSLREMRELLPRYAHDNVFESSKFKRCFPDFSVTTYRDGLFAIRPGHDAGVG